MKQIKYEIYNYYKGIFIVKNTTIKDIPFQLRPIVYEIHDIYRKTKQKINNKSINDYIHRMDYNKLCFVFNYYV